MQQELPLYIFIRNSIMLCLAFFFISSVIIERGRKERGENSLFNISIIKKNGIRDYKNINLSKSQDLNTIYEYTNFSTVIDSISKSPNINSFSNTLVDNKLQSYTVFDQVDL